MTVRALQAFSCPARCGAGQLRSDGFRAGKPGLPGASLMVVRLAADRARAA